MDTLKVGIVGAGFMGQMHTGNLEQLDAVEVTCVCDVNLDAAQKLCVIAGPNATAYTSFDEMLAAEKLDVLYVCLPPFAHNGEVQKAAAKGIHLFLEKPIAINSEKAADMVNAIKAADVNSQVGFHMRFYKSIRELSAKVADGSAGKPVLFQGRFWCNLEGSAWWKNKEQSGGQIYEQLIHIYDLAIYLFGEPKTACGFLNNILHTDDPTYTVEDVSAGLVQFENGAVATITGSNASSVPVHFFGDFQINFENVNLEYKSSGQSWVSPDTGTLYCGEEKTEVTETENAHFLETKEFIEAIRAGRPAAIPASEGLKSIRLIEQIIASAK